MVPFQEKKHLEYIFAIKMPNDSMEPYILENDILIIDLKKESKTNEIVLAQTKKTYVIRKLRSEGQIKILEAINMRYPLIEDGFHIDGVVTKIIRDPTK